MKLDNSFNRSVDRLALLLLMLVLLLMGIVAFITHQNLEAHSDVNGTVHENLEALQETTEEMQETVAQLQTNSDNSEVEELDQSLETMQQQLAEIESELTSTDGSDASGDPNADADNTTLANQGRDDNVVILLALLASILSILTSVALLVVFTAYQNRSTGLRRTSDKPSRLFDSVWHKE